MTATATFYDGNDRSAVLLGTVHGSADPESLRRTPHGAAVLAARDPMTYADAVTDLLHTWPTPPRGQHHRPADDHHRAPDPVGLDPEWIYAFQHGRVWIATGPTSPTAATTHTSHLNHDREPMTPTPTRAGDSRKELSP